MRNFSVTSGFFLLSSVHAFIPEVRVLKRRPVLSMSPSEGPAGSFFHELPDEGPDEKSNESASKGATDIDDQVSELLRRRRKPPLASEPSTINGIPTPKSAGFGKPVSGPKSSKPFVAIGPQDPPLNDPSKPEFDDQGYTLYTDSETGKKSRVFEALVEYPCDFTMKIVGANEGSFVEEMVALVAEACNSKPADIPYSIKMVGKWTSVTVQAPVESAEMLYTLYEKVDLDPRVKFKF